MKIQNKLPVSKVLVGAFALLWWYRDTFLHSLAAPIFFLSLMGLFVFYASPDWHPFYFYYIYIIYAVLFTILAVTCHRIVLLGVNSVPAYGLKLWSRREFRFLWFVVGIYMVVFLPTSIAVIVVANLYKLVSDLQLLVIIVTIPAYYVMARLSLVFPATAIDKKATLKWSWQKTRNNGWRMFVVVGVFPWMLSFLMGLIWRENATLPEVVMLYIAGYFLVVIEVSALSLSYKELAYEGRVK